MSNKISKTLRLLAAIIFSLLSLSPIFYLIISSLKTAREMGASPIIYFPEKLQFINYVNAFTELGLLKNIASTLIVATCTAIIVILVTSIAAYAYRRFIFKGKYFLTMMILIFQMVPGIIVLIPFYFFYLKLGLINKLVGLILAYCVFTIPFSFLLLRSYMYSAYPISVDESAAIDGCSDIKIFFKITLPLCAPGILAVGLFAFIAAWNEFMFASVLIQDTDLQNIQVLLSRQLGFLNIPTKIGPVFAAAVICTIPVLIIGFFIQKFMVMGLSSGSIKE